MNRFITALAIAALLLGVALASPSAAYPGGTPGFQTDVAPFCATCHSSLTESALAGSGERAAKMLAENHHLSLISAGEKGYAALSPEQRTELVAHIRALDEASTVAIEAPAEVAAGETFQVTVSVTGGAGPAVAIGLVDAAHRNLARAAPAAGWQVVGAPAITGQDFKEQTGWIARRPEVWGRNLSYVNVTGVSSDATTGDWGHARVVWTLRAPQEAGKRPLAAAYWYGTEKASPHGFTTDPIRGKQVRGGFGGHSGRVRFSDVLQVEVK